MASATSAKKGSFFLLIFFLISAILGGYYAVPWALKKAAASGRGFDRAVMVFPDSSGYDPNPSACHDTWGCVNFETHPDLPPGELPVYPSRRLKHPTIIYRTVEDSISYLISIDGSNEGSEQNPRATHTMMRAGIPPISHGARVRVRFVGGALSDLYGHKTPWDVGSFIPQFMSGTYLYNQMRDGHYAEALLVRLVTASGRHTMWRKFCVMETPGSTPFFIKKECGNYELEIANELGEDAWLEFFQNSAWTWESHLTGADALMRDYFAKGAGFNGDRLSMMVRYVYGR